ncbi:porin (plasmid) [Rhizobium sp. CB3171]|uniref:porin n=1 Tax=Rhizobium sp. CB3171 TaxID=3039157 RepID=UPI0024B1C28F|nr:porin [Rhizobium sp. CB3171]WFU05196.1 porin [Rhizobium sp. CB3171]
MNIKSLLFGSAAAVVTISGAQAADAIVAAQPEPLEYVRICDAYGAGYFFIPGTETCLKVGGLVRTEGKWYNAYNPGSGGNYGTLWHTRAQLSIDTATDTEYGPLKTNTVYRWDWQEGGATTTKLLWANISLDGFLIGKQDSQYNLFTGYAGNVINDDVVYDGPYELNQITYNYDAGNGFTAVISLEDSNSGTNAASYGGAWVTAKADHYAPNVVAGAGYKAGAWQFRIVGGYDSIVEEGAIKARVDADFGVFKAFLLGGWNTDGDKLNQYAGSNLNVSACTTAGVVHGAKCGWGDWALWTGITVPINDKLQANAQFAYTDSKILEVTANVRWNPVKNLLIQPEVTYTNFDTINDDQWAGILRFQRSF